MSIELPKEWQFRSEIVRPDDVRIEVSITVPRGAVPDGLIRDIPELAQMALGNARQLLESNEALALRPAEEA